MPPMLSILDEITPKWREAVLAAHAQHYVIERLRRGHRDELASLYYDYCREVEQPAILVGPGRKYCRIGIDLLPADRLFTEAGWERLSVLFHQEAQHRDATMYSGKDLTTMYMMPLERQEAIVAAVWEILQDPTVTEPRGILHTDDEPASWRRYPPRPSSSPPKWGGG